MTGVAIAVFAIRGGGGHTVDTASRPTTTTSTLAPTTTTTRDPRRGNGQAVTIAFGGDVHFEGAIRTKLLAQPSTMFSPIAPMLSSADLAMVNLESALTEVNTPVPKEFNFKAPATALDAMRAAGIDVVTEANNHSEDYGPQGLADSLAARAAKSFPVIGIGANATNFVFYNEAGDYGRTGVLMLTVTGRDVDSYQFLPARILGGIPNPIPAGSVTDSEVAHWNSLRACTDLTP